MYVNDHFLLQVIKETMRRGTTLHLVLISTEILVGNVKVKGILGCSEHDMVELKIFSAARGVDSKLTTLKFRRGNLTFSRIYLVQSHEMRFHREEGPNKDN